MSPEDNAAHNRVSMSQHLVLFAKGHYGNYGGANLMVALKGLVGQLVLMDPEYVHESNLLHLLGHAALDYQEHLPRLQVDLINLIAKSHAKFLPTNPVEGMMGILTHMRCRGKDDEILVELPKPDPEIRKKLDAYMKQKAGNGQPD